MYTCKLYMYVHTPLQVHMYISWILYTQITCTHVLLHIVHIHYMYTCRFCTYCTQRLHVHMYFYILYTQITCTHVVHLWEAKGVSCKVCTSPWPEMYGNKGEEWQICLQVSPQFSILQLVFIICSPAVFFAHLPLYWSLCYLLLTILLWSIYVIQFQWPTHYIWHTIESTCASLRSLDYATAPPIKFPNMSSKN